MSQNFIQPRFTGRRFENHALPLDVIRDLSAYETLLIELAKYLYLNAHPERQRVPKGFSDVHLAIIDVEEGSVKPALALVAAVAFSAQPAQHSLFHDEIADSYFEQARELIAECISAPESALPEAFPREFLSYFNQLGRSLREDETLQFSYQQEKVAVLTLEKRKKLVLAANKNYEDEVRLSGFVGEADWERSTFRLRHLDGSQTIVPMPENFHDKIRQSGGRDRDYVLVDGVAAYDSSDRLQKVLSVKSLEVVKNYPLSVQFEALAQLKDGWFEGQGLAPDKERLDCFAQKLIGSYPERLLLPVILPTQDGNILLEWDAEGDPSADIDLRDMRSSFHAFGPEDQDIEADFVLDGDEGFEAFFDFLSAHIQLKLR